VKLDCVGKSAKQGYENYTVIGIKIEYVFTIYVYKTEITLHVYMYIYLY